MALIAALASDAELLILDEPTAGLDPLMEAVFRECVDDERQRGRTVLLSSHILAEAEALADRVTIIRDGRTTETGTLADMRHLTRSTVDAELSRPISLDGLPRPARGIAIGVLGAAYLLRAVGDAASPGGPSWLTWLSPLGWTEFIRPYTSDRWQLLALPLATAAAAVVGAYALAVLRDHGAGVLPDRPGRPAASAWLRGPGYLPLGLAWRLQRGTLYGWAAGFAFTFAASGAAAKGIGSLLGGSAQLRNAFTRLGGQAGLTDAYLLGVVVVIALFGQVLRLSGWILDLSPFSHVPKLPGAAVTAPPLLWLALAALALTAAGLTALRRRDIG